MIVDLVQVTTRDGVRLDGMFQAAGTSAAPAFPASPGVAHTRTTSTPRARHQHARPAPQKLSSSGCAKLKSTLIECETSLVECGPTE